jgi:excisionase family DNA binding protein
LYSTVYNCKGAVYDYIVLFQIRRRRMREILLTKEAADLLRVGEEYLRELIRAGKIKAYKEGRRGGYRIARREIDRYIKRKCDEETRSRIKRY